jgi:hypothetical protein
VKLRIQGDVLRLRLTQNEVKDLLDHGLVECAIQFPKGRELRYCVASLPSAAHVSADYLDDSIVVVLPRPVVIQWAQSEHVSIQGSPHSSVQILVEKDFQCLHKPSERDPDAYPNPLELSA